MQSLTFYQKQAGNGGGAYPVHHVPQKVHQWQWQDGTQTSNGGVVCPEGCAPKKVPWTQLDAAETLSEFIQAGDGMVIPTCSKSDQQGFTEHNPYLNLGAPVLEFANDTKTDGKIAACYCSAYSAVQLCSLIQACRCSNKLVAFIVEIIDGMCGLCKAFQNDGLGLIQRPTAVWNILYCLIMTVSVLLKYLLPIKTLVYLKVSNGAI